MKQDKEKKKQIIKDWNNEFPMLKYVPTTKLLMRLDIITIGIWFLPGKYDGNVYDPILMCGFLWKEEPFQPHYIQYLENVQRIEYSKHDDIFYASTKEVKKQCGNLFKGEVAVSDLFRTIKAKYFYKFSCGPFLFERVIMCELMLALAAYFHEDHELSLAVKNEIKKDMRNWSKKHFQRLYDKSPNEWFDEMIERFSDHDAFMKLVNENSSNPKVARLREGHLYNDGVAAIEILKKPNYPLKKRISDWLHYLLWK